MYIIYTTIYVYIFIYIIQDLAGNDRHPVRHLQLGGQTDTAVETRDHQGAGRQVQYSTVMADRSIDLILIAIVLPNMEQC